MLLTPRQLEAEEHLTLTRVLGKGGFATVFKGTWTRPGSSKPETVSVKALLPQHCDPSCTHYRQFAAEATFLHAENHPNVLKCHGLLLLPCDLPGLKGSYQGLVLAMILDYVKDGTLLSLLTAQLVQPHARTYSLSQALHVLLGVAEGLAHLHGRQPAVVHRDVKPGNILLSRGGRQRAGADGVMSARLADFGLLVHLEGSRPKLLRRSGSSTFFRSCPSQRTANASTSSVFFSFPTEPELPRPASDTAPAGPGPAPAHGAAVSARMQLSLPSLTGAAAPALSPGVAGRRSRSNHLPIVRRSPELALLQRAEPGDATSSLGGDEGRSRLASKSDAPHLLLSSDSGAAPAPAAPGSAAGHKGSQLSDAEAWTEDSGHPGQAERWPGPAAAPGPGAAAAPGVTRTSAVVLRDSGEGEAAEWVFDLTEGTGSLVYMAPEVGLRLPYNCKADVYSFGVVMYEVLGRTLLGKTCMAGEVRNADDFAKRVVAGWRPDKPNAMAPELWQLVEACWHGNPNQRPSMDDVAAKLRALLPALVAADEDGGAGCRACVIC